MKHQSWGLEYQGEPTIQVETTETGVMITTYDDSGNVFSVGAMANELSWLIETLGKAQEMHSSSGGCE